MSFRGYPENIESVTHVCYCGSRKTIYLPNLISKKRVKELIEEFSNWVCEQKNKTGDESCYNVHWTIEEKNKDILNRLEISE